MPPAQLVYRPRDAEHTVLYGVVREHLDAFLRAAEAGDESRDLPPFIEHEFREFLTCGILAHGFARLRCEAAPSSDCALLLQGSRLLPELRRPPDDRARRPSTRYRRRAEREGLPDRRTGTVTVIQRFGSGLNLNIHFHTLVLDGVFTEAGDGSLEFHPAPPPTDAEVGRLLAAVDRRLGQLLARRGLDPDASESGQPDPVAEESASLAGMAGASVLGRIALGPRAGGRVRRLGQDLGGAVPSAHGPARRNSGASTSASTLLAT